jgi:hypothetical protein
MNNHSPYSEVRSRHGNNGSSPYSLLNGEFRIWRCGDGEFPQLLRIFLKMTQCAMKPSHIFV